MHMLSRNDLNIAELETGRASRNPQRLSQPMEKCKHNEEEIVYVYDLALFLTVQILEDTPAVLSLGKLCEDHGYSYEWTSGQKTRLITYKPCTDRFAKIRNVLQKWH